MRSGYKITLGILTIMILVTITVGTSYSYYSIASEQANPNELATTCFEISFSEGSNGSINLAATYPMSEESALTRLNPYNFTITNTCSSGATTNYIVTLNTLTASPSNLTSYINYKLNTVTSAGTANAKIRVYGGDVNADGAITDDDRQLILSRVTNSQLFNAIQNEIADVDNDQFITASDAAQISRIVSDSESPIYLEADASLDGASSYIKSDPTLNGLGLYVPYLAGTTSRLTASQYDLNSTVKQEQGIDTSYSLATGTLNPGESVTYNLYLWIDESATNDVMNQNFTGRVLVYSYM